MSLIRAEMLSLMTPIRVLIMTRMVLHTMKKATARMHRAN